MPADSEAIFRRIEDEELQNPSASLTDETHSVYQSHGEPTSMFELNGDSILTDFGSARFLTASNRGWWMPDTCKYSLACINKLRRELIIPNALRSGPGDFDGPPLE